MSQACNKMPRRGVARGALGAHASIATMRPQTPDAAVARLALRQQGNVTYEQLLACELSPSMIARRHEAGRLYRAHLGVYSVGRPPQTPIEKASAAVLACGPGAALSHLGALALWGFTPKWPASFEAIVQHDRRPNGIATHRYKNLKPADFRTHLGVRATSPARTLLDSAPRLQTKQRARTINDALRTPFLTEQQLQDVCVRFPHHPGTTLTQTVLHGDRTRSPLEDDFPAFCRRYGLPTGSREIPADCCHWARSGRSR